MRIKEQETRLTLQEHDDDDYDSFIFSTKNYTSQIRNISCKFPLAGSKVMDQCYGRTNDTLQYPGRSFAGSSKFDTLVLMTVPRRYSHF